MKKIMKPIEWYTYLYEILNVKGVLYPCIL